MTGVVLSAPMTCALKTGTFDIEIFKTIFVGK
jgi:hypothetical protein